ncbi:MAG: 3'-5' exonuclease, partial [Desulfobacteraceae bacterium]|nr:3'-5' exonuclease [Desulfobacteraceae bacterium]
MYIYLDTETTGADEEDYLCQLAYKTNKGLEVNELFKPPVPIKFGAMATHHITEKMVAGKPAFLNSQTQNDLVTLLQDPGNILVAHNAQFDVGMLKKEGVEAPRIICTLKLIKTLDAEGELESYKLQYLRYYYGMEIEAQAHDAWGDILVLEQLFIRIFKEFQKKFEIPQEIVAEMIRISENPILMAKIPMGKHRGLHFRDVPKDYLQWIVG